MFVFLALFACAKREDKQPGAAADPWASPATPATPAADADPWAAKAAPVESGEPAQRPQASGQPSTLAGSYQCQQLRYGTSVNGIRQSTYVASALGVFEIDADGSYRSESYRAQGNGRVRLDANTVRFDDGPYAGKVGEAGTTSSGSFHIRFSGALTEAPAPSLQFDDHMCYRK
jgi:hypothetical protein